MSIVFRSDYFDDPRAKAAFERTTKVIFGLDFKRWKERGLWDTRYIAFSAFDGGECVASACVYTQNLVVESSKMTCAQILTVGTLPEYRRMGLQRELWHRIQRWKPQGHRGFFLFTDDSSASFYGHLGLVRRVEYYYIADVPHPDHEARFENRLLDVEDRVEFLFPPDVLQSPIAERRLIDESINFVSEEFLPDGIPFHFSIRA